MYVETTPRLEAAALVDESAVQLPSGRSAEAGLALLFQARESARRLNEDPWEFAVEIDELKAAGMTVNDLRWLMISDFLDHASDVSTAESVARQFREAGRRRFSRRSCFVLTSSGLAFATRVLAIEPHPVMTTVPRMLSGPSVRPVWDPVRHELSLAGRVVKRFKQHSPNQEAILTAFEEEGWPGGVLDPLTPDPRQDPKQRLRDTIKNLNRHQIDEMIHFSGDGSGQRVLWEPVTAAG